jgi:hypothetical protein
MTAAASLRWSSCCCILHVMLLTLVAVTCAPAAPAEGEDTGNAEAIRSVDVGVGGHFKVGRWTPVQVRVNQLSTTPDSRVRVTAPDNHGVPTIAAQPLPSPDIPDSDPTASVFTNIGRMGSSIEVVLDDGGTASAKRTITSNAAISSPHVELPATSELLVFVGPMPKELLDSLRKVNPTSGKVSRKAIGLSSVYDLPEQWYGYDAVDVVVLTAGGEGAARQAELLAADESRLNTLVRWVELGGRLVIFCGGENAESLFSEGKPLARLLPGKLTGTVRLPGTGRLEDFARSDVPIGGRVAISVPELADISGKTELYEGRPPNVLPLIVRQARGLGEIAFVGVDVTRAPLSDWPSRGAFLNGVLRPYLNEDAASATQTLVTSGYNDLSGALRQRMGRTFAGVAPVTFTMVALLAVAYLAVLGPLDYFVVRRWLKRTLAAWLTFPLIVLLFGGMAFALADWRHGGDSRRVNQLELVDIDTTSDQARGTVWSAVFSPNAERIDVRLDVEKLGDGSGEAEVLMSSWALPGAGIGGTQSGGLDLAMSSQGYEYGENYDKLLGVPVLTSGTKSLLSRWTAKVEPGITAKLTDVNELVAGYVENRTGKTLRNARLFYRDWGFWLGNIKAGGRIEVGEELSPRKMRTIVTQDVLGRANRNENATFVVDRASVMEVANLMMFYDAAGGFGFAQLPNRFQAYCDLSRLPELDRAVLVAEVDTEGSKLVDAKSGEAIGDVGDDGGAVIYRFVLPVRDRENRTNGANE